MMEIEVNSELMLPDGRPLGLMNMTQVASGDIAQDRSVRELASQLGSWIEKSRRSIGTRPGMFNRELYANPVTPYDQMRTARIAVREDDIVGGLAEATEALAFDGGLKWEAENQDDADVFNQLSADLNLDGKIREMWREEFSVDQFVCAKLWDTVDYTVRGKTENGNRKKKKYTIYAPVKLILLKSEHVVPIGYGPLRDDRLAWQATANEVGSYVAAYNSDIGDGGQTDVDPLMTTFFTRQYVPGPDESVEMSQWGVNQERLLEMNPDWVFRHTNTRPDYQKFSDIRLASVFALLDLKRQLMASDRAMLVGAANYILLIRKGSDNQPATQQEVSNLKENYNFLAKLPVIISDHRLEIDVIAPKLDFVLSETAYNTLDERILRATLSTFKPSAGAGGSSEAVTAFTDVLASSLQNRRHMIKRTLERELAKAVVDHPKNAGIFDDKPSLVFTPRNVSIGTNQAILSALLALRTQRELSRDTILEYLGLDEATEAQRLDVEEKFYDDIFKTQIPFSATSPGQAAPAAAPAAKTAAPAKKAAPTANGTPEAPKISGARGGRPAGGGTSKKSPAATAKPKTRNGNPSTED